MIWIKYSSLVHFALLFFKQLKLRGQHPSHFVVMVNEPVLRRQDTGSGRRKSERLNSKASLWPHTLRLSEPPTALALRADRRFQRYYRHLHNLGSWSIAGNVFLMESKWEPLVLQQGR